MKKYLGSEIYKAANSLLPMEVQTHNTIGSKVLPICTNMLNLNGLPKMFFFKLSHMKGNLYRKKGKKTDVF